MSHLSSLRALAAAGALLAAVSAARPAAAQEIDGLAAAAALEQALVKVIEDVEPSVVAVLRYRTDDLRPLANRAERFLPLRDVVPQSLPLHPADDPDFVPNDFAAGIIIQPPDEPTQRLILTTYHAVKGSQVAGRPSGEAAQLYVRFSDRRGCPAAIRAADPRSDLAVLELDTERGTVELAQLKPMKLVEAENLRKGQLVVALGNPYALARDGSASASWGMISNLGRQPAPVGVPPFDSQDRKRQTVHHLGTLLQVSMPLNLGTSGGPLLNLRGECIGVTTSLAALEGYEKSVGYAIPLRADMLRAIDELSRGWEVEYGLLGVLPDTQYRGGQVGLDQPSAARVASVSPGSPAALAGVRTSDVITAINGTPVHSQYDLMREIGRLGPGAEAKLTVVRGRAGAEVELTAVLTKWPPDNETDIIATRRRPERTWRGLTVDFSTARHRFLPRRERYDSVLVEDVAPEFRADDEIQPGIFITHVNGYRVRTPAEFHAVVSRLRGGVQLSLDDGRDVLVRE
ncbi:MAG: trypsin-like peptidase domain-containing protein [Planctomycetes bacterium]|nr:trypsin-like peptidase domain-containing protein [Planctomycetota bacterium]